MIDLNNYEYWYVKALKEIKSGSVSRFVDKYLGYSLKLNPYHIDSWILYTGYHNMLSHNDKIVENINNLLKYKPKNNQDLKLFKFVLEKVSTYIDADTPLEHNMREGYPDTEYSIRYCGEWLIAAIFYWKNENIFDALSAFKKSFSYPLNKNLAILWYINLDLNFKKKQYNIAKECGEKAVELDPKFKHAWAKLGQIYLSLRDFKSAMICVEEGLKLDKIFKPILNLKEEILKNAPLIKKNNGEKEFLYQRNRISKEELDFLLELENECEKPIPLISEVEWNKTIPKFGTVIRDGHIVELGLTFQAESLKLIPESIENLDHLEVLSISGLYNLKRLPEGLIYLEKLKYLRYEHELTPYSQGSTQSLFLEIIGNIKPLEKLHLSGISINELPTSIAFLPNLTEINVSSCSHLKTLTPVLEEFFEYRELVRPLRRYLIRKKQSKEYEEVTFEELYNLSLTELKSEDDISKKLISVIESTKLLKNRINGIKLLRRLTSKSNEEFKFLENLLISDKSVRIKIAAINVILHKYSDIAYDVIKYLLKNETDKYITKLILRTIRTSNSTVSIFIKSNLLDFLFLKEIEEITGILLPEITNFEVVKKKYQRRGPHGFLKKGNRITHLGLNTRSYLVSHDLTTLPESIGNLEELEELKLIDCWVLRNLPEEIGKLKKLTTLDCTGCRSLETLPNNMGNLMNLECLKLSECYSLRTLPPTINKLKKLKILDLTDCQTLLTLPEDLKGLDSLSILNLENCRTLQTLPNSIVSLQNLTELNLNKCRNIRLLPEELGNIQSLQILKLKSCTRLTKIPKSISNQKQWEELNLSYCYHLKHLPENIDHLRSLKKLVLRGCRELITIPDSIGNLKALEEFDLYACRKLKILPYSIGNLNNLRKLELSYCSKLLTIPESIKNVKKLEEMNLDGCNSLGSIKNIVGNLDNLKVYRNYESRPFLYENVSDNMYNIQPSSYNPDDPWSSFQLRKHQNNLNLGFDLPDIFLDEEIQNIIKDEVCLKDAKILEIFYNYIHSELERAEIHKYLEEDFDDMEIMHHFKIDNKGRVIELHLHAVEAIYLTIFPKQLCSLENLEIIRFPNNLIEDIPKCITKLKSLRIFDVSNFERPMAKIHPSIKSFIESLEAFNEFYKIK